MDLVSYDTRFVDVLCKHNTLWHFHLTGNKIMKELGMVLLGCMFIGVFFSTMIYPNLEYTGYSSSSSCYGECYQEYIRTNGTLSEQMEKKREIANLDEFSPIRGLWAGCAACHGQEGQGMAVFPALAGQSSDYITQRLYAYKNRETVGAMSSTMWGQAGMLSDADIKMIGKFVEVELK